MTSYAQKLRDPRWQRRRLEILERDGFKCAYCGDNGCTLHVHHKRYRGEPWEALDDDLETVCEVCHDGLHASRKCGKRIGDALVGHMFADDYAVLAEAFENIQDDVVVESFVFALAWIISGTDDDAREARSEVVKSYLRRLAGT